MPFCLSNLQFAILLHSVVSFMRSTSLKLLFTRCVWATHCRILTLIPEHGDWGQWVHSERHLQRRRNPQTDGWVCGHRSRQARPRPLRDRQHRSHQLPSQVPQRLVCTYRRSVLISPSLGSLLSVFGYATFTSARSIEVEVIVECEYFRKQETLESHRERTADAFFTYVCIGKDGRTRPIAQLAVSGLVSGYSGCSQSASLQVNSKEEEAAFSQGKDRYQKRKLERQASIEEMKKSGDAAWLTATSVQFAWSQPSLIVRQF